MMISKVTEHPRRLASTHIAIVGLGLMGGSLALALRGKCGTMMGVDTDPQACEYAQQQHIVDEITDFKTALNCDLLILATPAREILASLQRLNEMATNDQRSTIVLDLGSTKNEIVHAMQPLQKCFDPIGGHPMCGKELSGLAHAEKVLYRNKVFVLTPLERTSAAALALAHELIAAIGAVPLLLSAERHDALAAIVSHLPYVMACALMGVAQAQNDPQVWTLAASGFRDTSRLAASDLTMMVDILLTNREAILDTLKDYQAELDMLTNLIDSGDKRGLCTALAPGLRQRAAMFK